MGSRTGRARRKHRGAPPEGRTPHSIVRRPRPSSVRTSSLRRTLAEGMGLMERVRLHPPVRTRRADPRDAPRHRGRRGGHDGARANAAAPRDGTARPARQGAGARDEPLVPAEGGGRVRPAEPLRAGRTSWPTSWWRGSPRAGGSRSASATARTSRRRSCSAARRSSRPRSSSRRWCPSSRKAPST